MGGDTGPHKPVHGPTTDSQFGEDETGGGAILAPPRHRPGLDDRGLPADAQGWCSRSRNAPDVRCRASCIGVEQRLRRTIMNENVAACAGLSESQWAIVMTLNPSGGGQRPRTGVR